MISLSARLVLRMLFVLVAVGCLSASTLVAEEMAVRWWESHAGASGAEVLGLWKFDGDEATFTHDSSSHQHKSTLRGAKHHSEGRFGGCLESDAGYPIEDKSHGLHVAQSAVLSPGGAFTVEMWLRVSSVEGQHRHDIETWGILRRTVGDGTKLGWCRSRLPVDVANSRGDCETTVTGSNAGRDVGSWRNRWGGPRNSTFKADRLYALSGVAL